jgi:hypothetical protein
MHLLLQGVACREQLEWLPRFWIFYTLKLTWRKKMKKILYLLPLLMILLACSAHPSPTQDVSSMVSATLTAIAQNDPQVVAPQSTLTPTSTQAQPIGNQAVPTVLAGASPSAHDFIPPMGTVTGNLSFPSSFIPAMRIAFFNLADGSVSYTDTGMNQGTYSINLPAGSYHVISYPYSAGMGKSPAGSPMEGAAGGYTQFVLCGLTAACSDHTLIPVVVTAGQTIVINPGDWYAPEGTFPAMPTDISTTCSASWFFTFDTKHLPLGSFCPEPVKILEAVGQDFEGGRVYRYAADPAYPADQRGTVFVIYNDGEWVTFPDIWDASQPSSDPSLVVPNGRYQPVDGIGKVWRENVDVRNRLGWAYGPQSKFLGRFQIYSVQSGKPSGDTHFFFIDHGKWGKVLLLNSVDMGPNKWEVAGSY